MEIDEPATSVSDVVCSLFSGMACATGPSIDNAQACAQIDYAYVYQLRARETAAQADLEAALAVLERRLQGPDLCAVEAILEADGLMTLRVASLAEIPLDPAVLAPGEIVFYEVDDTRSTTDPAPGIAILPDRAGEPFVVKWDSLLPADPIVEAVAVDTDFGWTIDISLTSDAADALWQVTRERTGRRLALVVDDVVVFAPTIMEPIYSHRVTISADFDASEAMAIAAVLNGGQLPAGVTLELIGEDVEPLDRQ